jgi:hypothetical protein
LYDRSDVQDRLLTSRQTQEVIRFVTVSFGFQVFLSIARRDDNPDRVAIYAGPKAPGAVFDTFDCSVETNAPRTTILGTSGTADAVNTPVRVCAVWNNAGDLMILWHEVIPFFL